MLLIHTACGPLVDLDHLFRNRGVVGDTDSPVITITAQPQSINVTEGEITGSLTVAANVTPEVMLTFQWFSNTTNSNDGGDEIYAETRASFDIPADIEIGTHYFFAEVSAEGAVSVRSNVARVFVTAPGATAPDNVVIPENITAVFGQTLVEIAGQLPANWTWDVPANYVGAAGIQQHPATYNRPGGYLPVFENIFVTVARAVPAYVLPTGLTAIIGQTLVEIADQLPNNWAWVAPNTPVGDVGQQVHYAVFTPSDTFNYETVERQVTVTVSFLDAIVDMVRIPPLNTAGPPFEFTMGCNDPNTWNAFAEHQVMLMQGFYMGIHEVTQEQWRVVMTGNTNGISTNPSSFTGDRLPVERVSWYDILVFANRLSIARGLSPAYRINDSTNPDDWGLVPTASNDSIWDAVEMVTNYTGYRLPTEAQWEFAARAGAEPRTIFYTGNNIVAGAPNTPGAQANIDTAVGQTTPVGSYAANAWGLYDMHGNVWELVWDWWGYELIAGVLRTDPTGAVSGDRRVRRGGSWDNVASDSRSALRGSNLPRDRWNSLGFRLVRPVQ